MAAAKEAPVSQKVGFDWGGGGGGGGSSSEPEGGF